jgi:hypothetical protein
MIVIVGLILLLAAVIVGVAGVLSNSGHAHALTHGFAVFGYHVTGSTGTLFLTGIVVGAVAMAGLCLLLAGARRTSRRGSAARRGLRQSRQETAVVSQHRDDLLSERDTARTYAASTAGNGTAGTDPQLNQNGNPDGNQNGNPDAPAESRWSGRRLLGRRTDTRPAAGDLPETLDSDPDAPVGASAAPAEQTANGSTP